MTYGDYIRQMDDPQIAVLLDIIQHEAYRTGYNNDVIDERTSIFGCSSASDWLLLMQTTRPEGVPAFGIM